MSPAETFTVGKPPQPVPLSRRPTLLPDPPQSFREDQQEVPENLSWPVFPQTLSQTCSFQRGCPWSRDGFPNVARHGLRVDSLPLLPGA